MDEEPSRRRDRSTSRDRHERRSRKHKSKRSRSRSKDSKRRKRSRRSRSSSERRHRRSSRDHRRRDSPERRERRHRRDDRPRSSSNSHRRAGSRSRNEEEAVRQSKDTDPIQLKHVIAANPGIQIPEAIAKLKILQGLGATVKDVSTDIITLAQRKAQKEGGGGGEGDFLSPSSSSSFVLASIAGANHPTMSGQSTKPLRDVYVGNLPPLVPLDQLVTWVNTTLREDEELRKVAGVLPLTQASWMSADKTFAFLEFLSPDLASYAIVKLTGKSFKGSSLKIGRPKEYENTLQRVGGLEAIPKTQFYPLLQAALNQSSSHGGGEGETGEGSGDLSSVDTSSFIDPATLVDMEDLVALEQEEEREERKGEEEEEAELRWVNPSFSPSFAQNDSVQWNRVMLIYNLPSHISLQHTKELISPFGELGLVELVPDIIGHRKTAIVYFVEPDALGGAIRGLQGLKIGRERPLLCQHAPENMAKLLLRKSELLARAIAKKHEERREALRKEGGEQDGRKGSEAVAPFLSPSPTRILRLKGFFSTATEEGKEVEKEVRDFLASLRFSPDSLVACPPSSTSNSEFGGFVFVELDEEEEAERLEEALVGVSFDGQKIQTQYVLPEAFAKGEY